MTRHHLRLAALLTCLLPGLFSCATVLNGTTQDVPISSQPSGADVWVDGAHCGTTPTTVELPRGADHRVRLELPGHHPEERVLEHVVDGAVAGNILVGGVIGWAVDATSGGQYQLVPERLEVALRPLGGAPCPSDGLDGGYYEPDCAEEDLFDLGPACEPLTTVDDPGPGTLPAGAPIGASALAVRPTAPPAATAAGIYGPAGSYGRER